MGNNRAKGKAEATLNHEIREKRERGMFFQGCYWELGKGLNRSSTLMDANREH